MRKTALIRAMACGVLAATAGLAQAQPLTETFTYQGRLSDTGALADGTYDFQFRLFTDAGATTIIGNPITRTNVQVVDGLFTVTVNFGGSGLLFTGDRRWLEVSVRPAGVGGYTAMSPAQEITTAPHATYSSYAGIAQIAESSMGNLTDAYLNGPTLDATAGDVAIEKSNGGIFDPATLRIGGTGGSAGGELFITSSNGGNAIRANANGSNNGGNLQIFDAVGTPIITAQMDVSTGSGGYFNVYRRNSGGSTVGFEVDGNWAGTESTQVTIRGEASTMFFRTNVTGDSAVQFPSGSINAVEMLNEPGVASITSSGVVLTANSATMDIITQRTINCPTSGYVLVIASAEAQVSHVLGSNSTANFGVSSSDGSLPSSQDLELRIPAILPTAGYDNPITVHGMFSVNSGFNTFYFLGDQNSTSGIFNTFDVTLSCIFIPTPYGTISSPSTWDGPDISNRFVGGLTPEESQAEIDQSILDNEFRIQRELQSMRARLEEMERLMAREEQQ